MDTKLRIALFTCCIFAAPAIKTPLEWMLGVPNEAGSRVPSSDEAVARTLLADIEARRSARPAADLPGATLAAAPILRLASDEAYGTAMSSRSARTISAVPPVQIFVETPPRRQAALTGYESLSPTRQPRVTAESFGIVLNTAGPGQYSSNGGDTFTQAGPRGVINNRTGQFSPTS